MHAHKYIFGEYNIYLIYSDLNGLSLLSYFVCLTIFIRSHFWWGWWQDFKRKTPALWDSFNTSFLEQYFGKHPSSTLKTGGPGKRCVCQGLYYSFHFCQVVHWHRYPFFLSYSASKHPALGWWTACCQHTHKTRQSAHISAAYTKEQQTGAMPWKKNAKIVWKGQIQPKWKYNEHPIVFESII